MEKVTMAVAMSVMLFSLFGCGSLTNPDSPHRYTLGGYETDVSELRYQGSNAAGASYQRPGTNASSENPNSREYVYMDEGALSNYKNSEAERDMSSGDKDEIRRALNKNGVDQEHRWASPAGQRQYSLKPIRVFKHTDAAGKTQPCKAFVTTVSVNGETQQMKGTACRKSDGSWEVIQ